MSANPHTRRQWVAALAAAAALSPQVPAQTAAQSEPGQLLEQARAKVRQNREALRRFRLPADVEPVTVFRA